MISDSKEEIIESIPIDKCCSYAFLYSLFSNSKFEYSNDVVTIDALGYLQYKIQDIVKNFYPNINCSFIKDKVCLSGCDVSQMLIDSGVSNGDLDKIEINGIDENMLVSECCKITYLKALYLCVGSFYYNKNNNENSYGYSLEFSFKNFAIADDCKALMKYFKFKINSSKRGNNIILYIKDSQSIYDFFTTVGAVKTALEIQNSLLIREIRNDTNRQSNCYDANLNKTINSSREQVKAIDYIIKNFGIDYLDSTLQEVALLRLANEDITLHEMQKLYSIPISRAGLKYKLDKIITLYRKLTD